MSANTLPEIANSALKSIAPFWKGVTLLTLGLLMSSSTLLGQVNPDSTKSSGKDALKNRTIVADSAPAQPIIVVGDTNPAQPVVVIGNDTLPTDSTIGPLSKEERREQKLDARLKIRVARGLPDPKIAVRRSLMLPGLGQAYNRSWWKIPIVYAGLGTFAYLIGTNHKQYKFFREVALCKNDSNPSCDDAALYPDYAEFDINSMISERNDYRRLRDLNVIFTALWYTLQCVDAYVDAHLKGFNVSDDLSMRLKPTLNTDPFRRSRLYMGATLSFRLR